MAIKRTKRNIKKTAKPVAPKENVVKREKTKKPKTQKPIEKKAPPKASQPKPKQPKRDYNREYSNSFEVVRGSRLIKFKRRIISYGIIAAIILTVLIIHILTPTGLVESIQNKVTTFGNANLPATVYSQNSEQFIRYGDAICSLNDTFFEVYSKNGVDDGYASLEVNTRTQLGVNNDYFYSVIETLSETTGEVDVTKVTGYFPSGKVVQVKRKFTEK